MARALAVLVGALLTACASVSTSYTPYKAEYGAGLPPITDTALLAGEGDVSALVGAGGIPIGTMAGYGNGWAGFDTVKSQVCDSAAARGATHVLFATSWVDTAYTPVTASTSCKGNKCTTYTAGGDRVDKPRAGYVLLRVPAERWDELHAALRPMPPRPKPKQGARTAGGAQGSCAWCKGP